jgi:hypothetical protein
MREYGPQTFPYSIKNQQIKSSDHQIPSMKCYCFFLKTTYHLSGIIVVSFPFTDLYAVKKRPALSIGSFNLPAISALTGLPQ